MVIDIIIILIIALSVFLGYKKGFIKLSVNLVAVAVAIIVTCLFTIPVTNFIVEYTEIDDTIKASVIDEANDIMGQNNMGTIGGKLIEDAKNGLIEESAQNIAVQILRICVGIILFLIVRIGLIFVTAIAGLVAKIPGLKQINELGGMIYGLLRALIAIYAVLLIVNIIQDVKPTASIESTMNKTYITKILYNNNPIASFVKL